MAWLPFPFEQHNVQQDYNAHEGLKGLAPYDLGHKNASVRPNDPPIPVNPRLYTRVLVAHRILRNTRDLGPGEAGIKAELLDNLWNLDLKPHKIASEKLFREFKSDVPQKVSTIETSVLLDPFKSSLQVLLKRKAQAQTHDQTPI